MRIQCELQRLCTSPFPKLLPCHQISRSIPYHLIPTKAQSIRTIRSPFEPSTIPFFPIAAALVITFLNDLLAVAVSRTDFVKVAFPLLVEEEDSPRPPAMRLASSPDAAVIVVVVVKITDIAVMTVAGNIDKLMDVNLGSPLNSFKASTSRGERLFSR